MSPESKVKNVQETQAVDSQPDSPSNPDHNELQQQRIRRRFVRVPLTAEGLQEDYEQNVLGTAAGFFCAMWATWLMGEPIALAFTSLSYRDSNMPSLYNFGAKDVFLTTLLASKIMFVRAALFKYVIRPILKAFSIHPFEERQRIAEQIYLAISLTISIASAIYFVPQLWSVVNSDALVIDSSPVSTSIKLFVLLQAAYRVSELLVLYFEGEARKDYYDHAALLYLMSGVVGISGFLGLMPLLGALIVAIDLPALVVSLARLPRGAGSKLMLGISFVVSTVLRVAAVMYLVYSATLIDPTIVTVGNGNDEDDTSVTSDEWNRNTRISYIGSLAGIAIIGVRYTLNILYDTMAQSQDDKDTETKKLQ